MEAPISTSFWSNPAIVLLIGAIPAAITGLLVYLRSTRIDEAAKQVGIASGQTASFAGAVSGFSSLVKDLQSDNSGLRDRVIALETENRELRKRVGELERINGKKENGGML